MLNAIKAWKSGTHRLTEKQIESLKRIKPKGSLIQVIPSLEDKPSLKSLPNFLIPLQSYRKHACFEIWLHQNRIGLYIFAREEKLLEEVKAQLNALYPNAFFRDAESRLIPLKAASHVCSATLSLEYYYCEIKRIGDFDYDPLTHLIESLDINAMLQIIFRAEKISSKLIERLKDRLKPEAPYTSEVLRKLSLPCFKVLIRFVAFSEDFKEVRRSVETLANAFSSFNGRYAKFKLRIISFPILTSSFSILKVIVKRKFPLIDLNQSFILSNEELAALFHLPIKVEDQRIGYITRPRLPLPALGRKENGITIGFLRHYRRGVEHASISLADLTRHIYITGSSGTGKTSLLINMIAQAQKKGYCVHVIDPHGDMAYDLVECLPERPNDIIFLDPLKVRFSLNPFELPPYRDAYERAMLAERIIGQIVELMKRIFGKRYWGPSLNRTFQNVVRTLYQRNDSPTFEEILNVLLGRFKNKNFANHQAFKQLQQELKKIPSERFDAVINKVDPFVKNALLRMLFCRKKSTIDFKEIFQPKKLVIWRLAKAEITEMNMQMMGSALITKLWFYCASRPREERNPVLLVIDEFQNFAFLETLQVMIAEARKFGIGLVLSHQHTKQLTEDLLGEVLGNTATKIIFRVSGEDALTLSRSINMRQERALANILVSLPDGSAVVKLRAGFGQEPIRPFEIFTLPPLEKKKVDFDELIARMRERFSRPTPTPPTLRIQAAPQDERLREFLEVVDRVGDKGLREISKASGIEPRKVKQLIEEAEKQGLVETERVKTKGRPRVVVKLTKEGREMIGKLLGREGSLLHRKIIEKISDHFKRLGYVVEIPVQGGREEQPDLIARGFNETIAVEVEVSADHPEQVRRNYEKNFWANRVIFIAPSQEVGWRIKNILGQDVEVYVLEVKSL